MAPYANMPKRLDVRFSLQGLIREDRQTQSFLTYCPFLDLYSAGRTRVEAKNALTSAVDSYIRICYERGILGRLLRDKGFLAESDSQPKSAKSDDGQFISVEELAGYDDTFDVDVPLHILAMAQKQKELASCPQ